MQTFYIYKSRPDYQICSTITFSDCKDEITNVLALNLREKLLCVLKIVEKQDVEAQWKSTHHAFTWAVTKQLNRLIPTG